MSNIFTLTPPPILGGSITVASLFMGQLGNNKWLLTANQSNPNYTIDTVVQVNDILTDTPLVNYLTQHGYLYSSARVVKYLVNLSNTRFLKIFTSGTPNAELYELVNDIPVLRNTYSLDLTYSYFSLNSTHMLQFRHIPSGTSSLQYRILELNEGNFTFDNPSITTITGVGNTVTRGTVFGIGDESIIVGNHDSGGIGATLRVRYSDLATSTIAATDVGRSVFLNYGFGTGKEFIALTNGTDYRISDDDDFNFNLAGSSWDGPSDINQRVNSIALTDSYALVQGVSATTQVWIVKRIGGNINVTPNTVGNTIAGITGRTLLFVNDAMNYGKTASGQAIYRITRSNTLNNLQLEIYKP